MRRIPWIDPLRGLAALAVLVSHVAYWSGGSSIDGVGRLLARGDVGVAIFFAVSAYLLTRGACAGRAPVEHYWRKRVARIVPAYLAALAATVVVAVALGTGEVTPRNVVAHLALVQGWTGDGFRGFTQAWSVTTEVTFYLLVPMIGRWLRRCRTRGVSPLPWLVGATVVGLVVQTLTASSGIARLGVVSTSVIGHLAWFCVGVSAAWVENSGSAPAAGPAWRSALGWATTAFVLVATPLGGPIHLETPSALTAFTKEALYALIAGLLLWAAITASDSVRHDSMRHDAEPDWMRTPGDLSYGLFLWHVLVLQVMFSTLHLRLFDAPFPLVLVLTLVVGIALARASWTLLERPAIRWAHRSSSR